MGIACALIALSWAYVSGRVYVSGPNPEYFSNAVGRYVAIVAFATLPLAAYTCWKLDRFRGLAGLIGAGIALLITFVLAGHIIVDRFIIS